jgi:hypothetical protein
VVLPDDFVERVSGDDGVELFHHMQNCFHIAVSTSPLAALVAKNYGNENIRRDYLLAV